VVLLIDNFDSFTFNLVQYIGQLGAAVVVRRNDALSIQEVEAMRPDAIVVSPGPRTPEQAGISVELIRASAGRVPILGVCLGHQCLGVAFGGMVRRARRLMHGKTSRIHHDGRTIFQSIPPVFDAMRYHSLVLDEASLPACLEISARSDDGEIMGIRHRDHCVEGVQFHPESILTLPGQQLVENFLRLADAL